MKTNHDNLWLGRFEKGVGFKESLRDFLRYLNAQTIGAGIVACLFAAPVVLVFLAAAKQGGLNNQQALSWVATAWGSGGIVGIILSLYYKKPLMGATSIAGAVMLGGIIGHFNYQVVLGAYIVAGLICLILGITGAFNAIVRWLPPQIIMAMIAGTFLRFGTGLVTNAVKAPIICAGAFLGFLLCEQYIRRVPRVLGALIFGFITAYVIGAFNFSALSGVSLNLPSFFVPAMPTWEAILAIGIPLAIISVGSEDVQAIGVLLSEGYDDIPKGTKIPINTTITLTGIMSMIVPFFGCHDWHLAGPVNAICAGPSAGPKEGRYVAAVIAGVGFIIIALGGSAIANFTKAVPSEFINFVAGLAILGALVRALRTSWSGKLDYGPFFTFVIAASGVTIAKVGAPFWALVVGIIVSLITEYSKMKNTEGGH
ncbi:benzoate/H(+) symporter BenE family transporter [Moorella naiadis]|uniref:benzoate/H(+) symporter BenE family transporter n=1 Tax=Moorella naiadis (nom. illeg.) TaxID=3093670 RepID=UPI003D9CB154